MLETFINIRSIITFIEEELGRINGSDEIKSEVLLICNNISKALGKIGEIEDLKIIESIKKELGSLSRIINRIEQDKSNSNLYILLITHISDIRFLFLSKKEQNKLLLKLNQYDIHSKNTTCD
jgi:hypothetical protein